METHPSSNCGLLQHYNFTNLAACSYSSLMQVMMMFKMLLSYLDPLHIHFHFPNLCRRKKRTGETHNQVFAIDNALSCVYNMLSTYQDVALSSYQDVVPFYFPRCCPFLLSNAPIPLPRIPMGILGFRTLTKKGIEQLLIDYCSEVNKFVTLHLRERPHIWALPVWGWEGGDVVKPVIWTS